MATTAEEVTNTYPLPVHRFLVTVGDDQVPFTSASGLDITYNTITYRDGVGNLFKMPGQLQDVTVTLSKGVFPGRNALYEWITSINGTSVEKKDVIISLTNFAGTLILISWVLRNAFPTSLTSPSFDATSDDIAVQQLTLTGDAVTIQTA